MYVENSFEVPMTIFVLQATGHGTFGSPAKPAVGPRCQRLVQEPKCAGATRICNERNTN